MKPQTAPTPNVHPSGRRFSFSADAEIHAGNECRRHYRTAGQSWRTASSGSVKAMQAAARRPRALTLPMRSPIAARQFGKGAGHSLQIIKNEAMENTIRMTGGELAAVHARRYAQTMGMTTAAPVKIPDPDLSVPERGMTGPVPIGEVMEPIRRIIAHPDRNRLMAEFCKRYW